MTDSLIRKCRLIEDNGFQIEIFCESFRLARRTGNENARSLTSAFDERSKSVSRSTMEKSVNKCDFHQPRQRLFHGNYSFYKQYRRKTLRYPSP